MCICPADLPCQRSFWNPFLYFNFFSTTKALRCGAGNLPPSGENPAEMTSRAVVDPYDGDAEARRSTTTRCVGSTSQFTNDDLPAKHKPRRRAGGGKLRRRISRREYASDESDSGSECENDFPTRPQARRRRCVNPSNTSASPQQSPSSESESGSAYDEFSNSDSDAETTATHRLPPSTQASSALTGDLRLISSSVVQITSTQTLPIATTSLANSSTPVVSLSLSPTTFPLVPGNFFETPSTSSTLTATRTSEVTETASGTSAATDTPAVPQQPTVVTDNQVDSQAPGSATDRAAISGSSTPSGLSAGADAGIVVGTLGTGQSIIANVHHLANLLHGSLCGHFVTARHLLLPAKEERSRNLWPSS